MPHQVTVAPAPKVPKGTSSLGAVPASQSITVGVFLEPRDPKALSAYVNAVSDRQSPVFGHHLARGEFAGGFGPTTTTIDAVESTLRGSGLEVEGGLLQRSRESPPAGR